LHALVRAGSSALVTSFDAVLGLLLLLVLILGLASLGSLFLSFFFNLISRSHFHIFLTASCCRVLRLSVTVAFTVFLFRVISLVSIARGQRCGFFFHNKSWYFLSLSRSLFLFLHGFCIDFSALFYHNFNF